jgi:perosamine synthetase
MSHFVYVVELKGDLKRDEAMQHLAKRGVPSRGYFSPVHTQPYIQEMFGYRKGLFPVAERVATKTIALPFHNNLATAEIEYVVSVLTQVLDEL